MSFRENIMKSNNHATNVIAYCILAIFSLFLIVILINSIYLYQQGIDNQSTLEHAEKWLHVFKDGFLLMGGALTTLIGYYFGNRGSEAALENAENYTKKAEALMSELDKAAPTYDENISDIKSFE